tara:strand:- start:445 stop:720 length:276 start_codon:yes stop_codon:yes gene_type:complete
LPSADGIGRAPVSVILKMRKEPTPTSDAVDGSLGFHRISRTGATGAFGARAGTTPTHRSFSHRKTTTFHSGPPPHATIDLPSGEKERETYS